MSNYLKWLFRWHILLIIILIILTGNMWSYFTYKFYDNWFRQLLLTQTINIAEGIDPKIINEFHATKEDLENPIYQSLVNRLRIVRDIIPRCRYLYLMGRNEDKKVFFFIDTQEETEETPPAQPGEIYEDASEELIKCFDTGIPFTEGPLSDEWGVWVSGLVPIKDMTQNKTIAVLGIDIDAKDWGRLIWSRTYPTFLFTYLVIIVILLSGIGFSRRKLQKEIRSGLKHTETVLTFLFSLIFTLGTTWFVSERDQRQHWVTLNEVSQTKIRYLSENLEDIRDVIIPSIVSFFECSEEVTFQEFQNFTHSFKNEVALFLSYLWIPLVKEEEREQFLSKVRENYNQEFQIWEFDTTKNSIPAKKREAYFPILFSSKNEYIPMLGFDINSNEKIKFVIQDAMKTKRPLSVFISEEDDILNKFQCSDMIFQFVNKPGQFQGLVCVLLNLEELIRFVRQEKEIPILGKSLNLDIFHIINPKNLREIYLDTPQEKHIEILKGIDIYNSECLFFPVFVF